MHAGHANRVTGHLRARWSASSLTQGTALWWAAPERGVSPVPPPPGLPAEEGRACSQGAGAASR